MSTINDYRNVKKFQIITLQWINENCYFFKLFILYGEGIWFIFYLPYE